MSIYLEIAEQQSVRLQTMGMGAMVGEVGFFLNAPRSATVIADTTSIFHRLTRSAMECMQQQEPDLALALKNLVLQAISKRLVAANREIEALNR